MSVSGRRRRGAVLAAAVLALAGVLALAVADTTRDAASSLASSLAPPGPGGTRAYDLQGPAGSEGETPATAPRRRLNSQIAGLKKWAFILIIVLVGCAVLSVLSWVCCVLHVGTCGLI